MMQNIAKIFFVFLLFVCFANGEEAQKNKMTLNEVFKEAFKRTEGEMIQKSRINKSTLKIDRLKGNYLPNVSLGANYVNDDPSGSAKDFTIDGKSYAKVSISQSVYKGDSYPLQLSIAEREKLINEHGLFLYSVDLYMLTSASYYEVKIAEQEIKNLEVTINLSRDRIAELQKLAKIGKSRKGEVLTAEAQLAVFEAQLEEAKGELTVARDRFSYITGLDKSTGLADTELQPPQELESYLSMTKQHPYIKILEADLTAAEDNMKLAKSEYAPQISATGNVYGLRGSGSSNREQKWDVNIGLTFPIFEGGIIEAKAKEAAEDIKEKEFFLSQQKRRIETEIRESYHKLVSIISQLKMLEKAVIATEQNYQEQTKDYRNSLVTNLDVIQALNSFQDSKRTLDRTRLQALLALSELKSAVADIPKE